MIEVTATILPRTVMNERSLLAQIAWSAMVADSMKYVISWVRRSCAALAPP